MRKQESVVHSHIFGRQVRPLVMSAQDTASITTATLRELASIGIDMRESQVRGQVQHMLAGLAMDDTQGLITTASISNPIQFLQAWLPGFVRTITAARKIDEILGIQTVGSWEDEEVVQGILEPVGVPQLYGDYTNIPLASWNVEFTRRTVLRWEQGFRVGALEEARSARVRINTAAEKRNSAQVALDIVRNRVGFLGYNAGVNRTYGLLNDPSLPAYVTAPATGTGSTTTWSTKSFLNITADLRAMLGRLRTASGDTVDPKKTQITLAVASNVVDFLSVTSDFGNSVSDWLSTTYPNVRVVSAPELNAANGGANVAYMFADRSDDGSTDGGATWAQLVPARFKALGTEKQAKGYVEDFSNATAGVLLKRPFLVQRLTGI